MRSMAISYREVNVKEVAKRVELSEPIDVDKIRVERDGYFPNAYIIDLPLDSTPDHIWQDIFEWEWKASRHVWDRKLFIMGHSLRLITPPSDIQEKLDWVREIIERTNKRINKYNREAEARLVQKEQLKKQKLEEEKANIEMIKEILRKKFGPL